MSGVGDEMALQQQEKLDQQQAANNARQYNADGSAKANDYHAPTVPQSAFPTAFPADAGAGGQLQVNWDQLTAIKNQMGTDLARLRAVCERLGGDGAMGGGIGGWDTADAFGGNATNAYEGITQFMQAL